MISNRDNQRLGPVHLRLKPYPVVFASLLTLMFGISFSKASVIEQLSFDEMASLAEFVFEGEVTDSEARWNAARSSIDSTVTFRIDDVLKGSYSGTSLDLKFAGGQVGEDRMVVEGQIIPKVGEKGIYFVEVLGRKQVNPLVGWSQGHFMIDDSAAGEDTMMTAHEKPLMRIEPTSIAPSNRAFSNGQALGTITAAPGEKGMSKQEFKRQLDESLKRD